MAMAAWVTLPRVQMDSLSAKHLPDLVDIPSGCFIMGSPEKEIGRDFDERYHKVCLEAYKMTRHEITVGSFNEFVDATGYITDAENSSFTPPGCKVQLSRWKWGYKADANWRNPGFVQQTDHPVVCISQQDAIEYAKWLSALSGSRFRLPREAEWEYAARAGTNSAMYWGDDFTFSCLHANALDQSTTGSILDRPDFTLPCDDTYQYTAPVGSFKENPFGLYDILGNVWEWTCSGYDPEYGGREKQCQSASVYHMVRGGSWVSRPTGLRSAYRGWKRSDERFNDTGFRIVEELN